MREAAKPWAAHVLTLLPDVFPGALGGSLLGTALEGGLWSLDVWNIRDFATDKRHTVDDAPYGGGAGLVMKPDVVDAALRAAGEVAPGFPRVYTSPRGRRFDQSMARAWAAGPGVLFLCGRFEGVDQRVLDHWELEDVSLGDFVMTGGEPAAQAMIDATVRLLPGVLGNGASTEEESFEAGLLEYPQYTRPTNWNGRNVPEVLLSGDHGKIADWRRERAERITRDRRPDLFRAYRSRQSEKSRK